MSRREQIFETGNQRKAYSSSSSLKDESQHSKPLKDATSSREIQCLYRCNNCDIAAPVEELRVPARGFAGQLQYHNKGEKPTLFHDMLLCYGCRKLYSVWIASYRIDPSRPCKRAGEQDHLVASINAWSLAYWKHRAQENRSVSLARREIPVGPEDSWTTPLAPDLC